MKTLCPACRSELSPGYAVCFGCGAILVEGQRDLSGRPFYVLAARWLVLTSWLSIALGPAYAILPSEGGAVILGFLAGSLGIGAALAGLLAQCPAAFILGMLHSVLGVLCGMVIFACADGAIIEGVGAALIALVAVALVLPAIRFWSRPLKPSDPWRCRRCGYSLYGLSEPRCPECGTVFARSTLHWCHWGKPPPASPEKSPNAPDATAQAGAVTKSPAQEKPDRAAAPLHAPDPAVAPAPSNLRL